MTEAKKSHTRKYARQPAADSGGTPALTAITTEDVRPRSKAEAVVALLSRDNGATLDDMIAATGWLPHTTRAALTGLRKKGHAIASEKVDGVRTYHITVAA